MVSVSVILPTARDDYSIIGLPDLHILHPTFNSLLNQSFKDFEVIVVDALYPKRRKWLDRDWGFPVKYVPLHENHRFWRDHNRWCVCGALNTAILHAEGELLVRVDDCSEFEDFFLEKFWNGYKQGYFPLAMHIRYLKGKPARFNEEYMQEGYEAKHSLTLEQAERKQILHRLYGDEGIIRDTRYPIVKGRGGKMIGMPNWYYGYSSVSLEAALKINGYNELFDGDKGQEDQEFGLRLIMAGYKDMFMLNSDHQVIEHEHEPIPADVVERDRKPIKCNYAIYLLNQSKGRWKANVEKLTAEEIEFIRRESLKPPCSPKPNFYEDNCQGNIFQLWLDNQNIFDLREERMLAI
jgi:glycosyltransferase involved in cell wall biosynthesis